MTKPCILCVAITGSLPTKANNPAVPITIAEQIESTQAAFEAADLHLVNHLESVEALKRPADLAYSAMKPARIAAQLGWSSNHSMREIVTKMYHGELL